MENKKYHYLYKTTNLINGDYYYGMHSTYNLNDSYLGSGKYLKRSINKYGKDNFKRELIQMFDTQDELIQGEIELITEDIIKEKNCLNIKTGGSGGLCNMVLIRDINDTCFLVDRNDERYLSGELVPIWKDKKHRQETKDKIGKANSIKQKGEKNSQFGKCWINKDGNNKSIKKELLEDYIKEGWIKGRICIITNKEEKKYCFGNHWITKDGITKSIKNELLEDYLKQGWVKGRNYKKIK